MKNYAVIFDCLAKDGADIDAIYVMNESELDELKNELKVIQKLRKSYADYFPEGVFGDLADWNVIRDVLYQASYVDEASKNSFNDKLHKDWIDSLSDDDFQMFESFNDRLPYDLFSDTDSILSIRLYELKDTPPINLYD